MHIDPAAARAAGRNRVRRNFVRFSLDVKPYLIYLDIKL
jgi:predicted transcriptional regulator with HTH domain